MTQEEKKILAAELKHEIMANFAKIENMAAEVDLKMNKLRKNVHKIKTDIHDTMLAPHH